ncbi:MAG TPA: DUF2314 domain-containing protein [Anaerolineales bacterium]|nr:DUF2314 domain-containing protein [Anaerolineales bacterium]
MPSPTAPVPAEDAELEAAIAQARDSLDNFIAKITTPHPDRTLAAVKVRFTPPGEPPQDIWVDQVKYADDGLEGAMGDDLPLLRLKFGETIKIAEEDIVDWAIVEDGKLVGGYTIRLAVQRMSPEEKERFLETLPYTIED